jgi:hypothetical protein
VKAIVIWTGVGLAVLCGTFYGVWRTLHSGELGEKPAWALLQGIEAQNRGRSDRDSPLLIEGVNGTDYTVLGLPTGDASYPRAWLIINKPTPGTPVKILPTNLSVNVTCSYIEELKARVQIEQAAWEFLRRNCSG